jgi:hypothetical protein
MWYLPILAVALGQVPGAQAADLAADLVNRLTSARYAERDAASSELEVMGTDALPALRAVSNSNDPELRTRVESLLAKIHSRAMSRASLVRLDFRDRPCDEILKDSTARWPNRLAWHPETADSIRRRQVNIGDPTPLAFWAAMDRLCRAAGLYYIPGAPGGPGSGTAQFRLFLAPGTAVCPRSDTGPLRFELTGISHFRTIDLIPTVHSQNPAQGEPTSQYGETRADFNVAVRALVEPRMLISRIGQALITEAVDDRGQSLLPDDKPHLQASASGSIPAQACVFIRLSLKHPERAGKTIKRLRMSLPVEVVARKPDPLVVTLGHARGKTFRLGHTSLQILDVKTDGSGHPVIELKVGMDEETASRLTHALPLESPMVWGQPVRPEISDNVLQIFDQRGRQYPWSGGADYQAAGPWITATLTLCPPGATAVSEPTSAGTVDSTRLPESIPSQLQYFELARAVVQAKVEFADIRLP